MKKHVKHGTKVFKVMVQLYCNEHHNVNGLCKDCRELIDYAAIRLEKCPFGEKKPSCRKCKIHCYAPEKKERVQKIMRYSGPRMMFHHPIMAIRHLISEML